MGDENMKNDYWVLKMVFRDGTKFQAIAKQRLDERKAKQRLFVELGRYYSDEAIKAKGVKFVEVYLATETESGYSRVGREIVKKGETQKNCVQRADFSRMRIYLGYDKESLYGCFLRLREGITKPWTLENQNWEVWSSRLCV